MRLWTYKSLLPQVCPVPEARGSIACVHQTLRDLRKSQFQVFCLAAGMRRKIRLRLWHCLYNGLWNYLSHLTLAIMSFFGELRKFDLDLQMTLTLLSKNIYHKNLTANQSYLQTFITIPLVLVE